MLALLLSVGVRVNVGIAARSVALPRLARRLLFCRGRFGSGGLVGARLIALLDVVGIDGRVLGRELLIGGPVALLLASLVGYFMAAAALRPVERMRSQAAAISAQRASERLPVAPAGDEEESEFGHFIPDSSTPLPDEAAELSMRRETLQRLLQCLSYRERRVLELRYGLGGEHPRTLDEVGNAFNVTRERIRQIENQSLKKLRAMAETLRLREVA